MDSNGYLDALANGFGRELNYVLQGPDSIYHAILHAWKEVDPDEAASHDVCSLRRLVVSTLSDDHYLERPWATSIDGGAITLRTTLANLAQEKGLSLPQWLTTLSNSDLHGDEEGAVLGFCIATKSAAHVITPSGVRALSAPVCAGAQLQPRHGIWLAMDPGRYCASTTSKYGSGTRLPSPNIFLDCLCNCLPCTSFNYAPLRR